MKHKKGIRVKTPDGDGVIIGFDLPGSNYERYIVKLGNRWFEFDPCYFEKEIKKIRE